MDITAITLLVGAALAAVPASLGWLAGRASGRAGEVRRVASTSGLLCSCGHGYGTHAEEQRCHGRDVHKRNGLHEVDPCPCRRYDGPEPLPKAWAPVHLDPQP